MWPDLIQKSKDGGLDVIETYVFWNVHEPVRNQVFLSIFLSLFFLFGCLENAGKRNQSLFNLFLFM